MSGSVVIAGSLAQKPGQGGHTWQFLQYLLGFKRLGWEVLFIDCLQPEMCVDGNGRPTSFDDSTNVGYFLAVMERFGLQDDFALVYNHGERFIGQPRTAVLEKTRRSSFLVNVMGFLRDESILESAPRRVFLDTDPGYSQMWQDLGLAKMCSGHDDYVTIAENMGQADCSIPSCGVDWITWRQPVVLDSWPACGSPAAGAAFTCIGSWRGPYGRIDYKGKSYGLRVHEFRKLMALPRLSRQPFEVALDIHAAEVDDLAALRENDWQMVDPTVVTADPLVYRSYIQGSRAELMVPRNMYVETSSGWFSERSICYLASGKPVLAQDTGFSRHLPTGEGLFSFETLDEALHGVEELCRDYDRQARAAREIAETYFDSDTVIAQLLDKLSSPREQQSEPHG